MNNASAPITGGQYSVLRLLLGSFLLIHFVQLIPYGTEIFSASGIVPASTSPLLGYLPNPLVSFDRPVLVGGLLLSGALCAVLLAIGYADRVAAFGAALILAWLYARNPLIANPSLPVVGWMLIAHLFVPSGAYGSVASRRQPQRWLDWHFPRGVWIAAWVMLAVAYSYSGYTKLLSPSWIDGTAIATVLDNPLARDHFLREWLLALPQWCLSALTYGVMWIELLFLPLALYKPTRVFVWTTMLAIQFGFLIFLDFADLTFPMLLIHSLTFDHRWLPKRRPQPSGVLFFDGWCGFCNGLVRFALAEDTHRSLLVAPLDGELSKRMQVNLDDVEGAAADSIVLLDERGKTHLRTDAVIRVLYALGGFWNLAATTLKHIPRPLRDAVYDLVGRWRYRLGKRLPESCQRIPVQYAAQLRL